MLGNKTIFFVFLFQKTFPLYVTGLLQLLMYLETDSKKWLTKLSDLWEEEEGLGRGGFTNVSPCKCASE